MRFLGRVFKAGRFWAIEVPVLDVVTQGRSKKDAFNMIRDATETLVDRKGFRVTVIPGRGELFEVTANEVAPLIALMLKHLRLKHGYSLAEMARRLKAQSRTVYARYEQGLSLPSIETLDRLLSSVDPSVQVVVRAA